jgi:hypothetical protein
VTAKSPSKDPANKEKDLIDASLNHVAAPLDDFQLFYSGARIYF